MKERQTNGVTYLTFENLEQTNQVKHCFTTRKGGISTGCFAGMNFDLRGKEPVLVVQENYKRLAEAVGFRAERFVASAQTHSTNVYRVTEADAGMGVTRPQKLSEVDALITDVVGIPLTIFGADCTPIFLLDCKRRAIGMAHSGWMGTGNRMAERVLFAMQEAFGTEAADVVAGFGPSIGQPCFQVDAPVVSLFEQNIPFLQDVMVADEALAGKYYIDLWEVNRRLLAECGVQNIEVAQRCTVCEAELFYSHRRMGTARGLMAGIMELTE